MKFAFDVFNIEVIEGGFRFAILELAFGARAGALLAFAVSPIEDDGFGGMEFSFDILWFNFFAFGGTR